MTTEISVMYGSEKVKSTVETSYRLSCIFKFTQSTYLKLGSAPCCPTRNIHCLEVHFALAKIHVVTEINTKCSLDEMTNAS